jgi:hypothetical protein
MHINSFDQRLRRVILQRGFLPALRKFLHNVFAPFSHLWE